MGRLFDLDKRVPIEKDLVGSLEDARGFDLSTRISMRFPIERVIKLVSPFCKEESQILNVGSQTGLLSLMLAGNNPAVDVLGIEENEFFVDVAEENMMLAAMAKSPASIDFQLSRMTALPIDDKAADMVISFNPSHRCDDPVKMLKECRRVCKDDGLIFIYDMARDAEEGLISFILQYISAGHEDFMRSLGASYTREEILDILKEAGLDGWQVVVEGLNLRITSREI